MKGAWSWESPASKSSARNAEPQLGHRSETGPVMVKTSAAMFNKQFARRQDGVTPDRKQKARFILS